ncbi:MAG: redox-sensing transcriptional repressor Rex [Planctomycetes bacterium]|nr:redox-sensing transcriptional repressor Rex [Planctomycetota bacterium]
MAGRGKIPRPTVKRLSLYLRELENQSTAGQTTINSRQLGDALDLTDAQVRKDLAYFGQFGHPGIGYQVLDLIAELRRILGTDHPWHAVVVGAGNIGRAVTRYGRLGGKGFEIAGIFDSDPEIIGEAVDRHRVRPMEDLAGVVGEQDVKIGLLAVPAEDAQLVAEALVAAGVRGILNFAPRRLVLKPGVPIVSVDLTVSLEQLAFAISLTEDGAIDG